jgi:uncharacterized protein (DUF433 family)
MKPNETIIRITPGVRSGKPCVRNLRITVADVLRYLEAGTTIDELIIDFPELTKEDIQVYINYKLDK